MRLLLDSHAALWYLLGHERLGPTATTELTEADEAYFSPVTPWELGIKRVLGKLAFDIDLTAALTSEGFTELPISAQHGTTAAALPLHHRDPFDRMLIAQARHEALTLATADSSFAAYDVDLLDATR